MRTERHQHRTRRRIPDARVPPTCRPVATRTKTAAMTNEVVANLRGSLLVNIFWAHKNCLWHSVLAFWSPNITYFSRKLGVFLGNFIVASIFGSLCSCLPWVVVWCPFPLLFAFQSPVVKHFQDVCWTFSQLLADFFFILKWFSSFYIVLLNLKQLSSLLYVWFLKEEYHISCYLFV